MKRHHVEAGQRVMWDGKGKRWYGTVEEVRATVAMVRDSEHGLHGVPFGMLSLDDMGEPREAGK